MGRRDSRCLGRPGERQWIQRALTASRHLRLLLLEGPPGAGKTTLAQYAANLAESRGWSVVWAHPRTSHGKGGRGELASAHPVLPAWLLGQPTSHLPGRSAEDEPAPPDLASRCLVVLEDIHRSDESTLTRLRLLHEDAPPMAWMVLLTARLYPSPPALAALRWQLDPASCRLLGPLPESVLQALAEERLGYPLGPSLKAQLAKVGGNPGLLLRYVDGLQRHRLLAVCSGPAPPAEMVDLTATELAQPLARELAARGWDLAPESQHWLKLASVFGPEFSLGALARLTGRHPAELFTLLEEALAGGVLEERGERLAFRPEIYRQALYTSLPTALRAELHHQAAAILQALGAPADEVGPHLVRAARSGPRPEAVAWLRKTASELAATAPRQAADLLAQAVALSHPEQPDFPETLADAAAAWVAIGETAHAEALCRQALSHLADQPRRAGVQRYLVDALVHRCHIGLAAQALQEADAAMAATDATDAGLEATAALVHLLRGGTADVEQEIQRAIASSQRRGDQAALARALLAAALWQERGGDLGQALQLATEAAACADQATPGRPKDPLPCSAQAMFLIDLDRFGAAHTLLQQHAQAENLWWPFWRFIIGFGRFWSGSWTRAEREFEAGMHAAQRQRIGWRVAARGLYALIRYSRGDSATAHDWMGLAATEWEAGDHGYRSGWFTLARMVIADAEGSTQEAAHWAAQAASLNDSGGVWATIGPWIIRCSPPAQRAQLAPEIGRKLAILSQSTPTALGAWAALQTVQGLLADDPDQLAQAAAGYAKAGRPFERALAHADAALVLARRGAEEPARHHLQASLSCYRELGATTLAAHTRERLAANGVRLPARRARPASGWDALTLAELRVLRLIVERRSNPEIAHHLAISRRTVETHVSNLLSKLGLETRWQLANEAARHFGWRLSLEETPDA